MTTRKKKAAGKSGEGRLNKLNEAALKKLDENAEQIVQALLDAIAKGNVMSGSLLIGLAKQFVDADQAEALRPFHALLLDLASEPEWPAEAADAVRRAGAGKADS